MKVLVTDANTRSALAVVRSLGRAGICVGVGDVQPNTLAGASKYCSERLVHPSPIADPAGFEGWLLEAPIRRRYDAVLPVTDLTVQLVARAKPLLSPALCVLTEDEPAVLAVQDKAATLALAARCGIATPRTVSSRRPDELLAFAQDVGYPVIVKPRQSRLLQDGRWREGKVRYAYTPEELLRLCQEVDAQIPDPLVQERLQGEGRGVFLLMWKGEVRAAFCHRRLREKPPWGGVSVLSESVASNDGLVEQSAQLLRAMNWNGPAMVEFKEDRLGGRPHLMEINGRFWGSLQLAVDSGVDFPLLYLKLAMGEAVPKQGPYRVGVRSRWLLADLDALVTRLRNAAKCDALCPRPLSRSRSCAEFLRPGAASGRLDVFRREDAAPAWLEWKQYLRTNLSWVLGPTHD